MLKQFSTRYLLLVLAVTVIILQLYMLKDFWGYGFAITEDWTWLAYYTMLKGDLLSKFLEIWRTHNLYQGSMIIYVGLIDQLFQSNYLMIQVISFIGKIVATILFFPAILALTKNRLLAFLGSLFFAISYAATGSFITYTNSMEYWGISFLGLFVICYHKLLISKLKVDYRNFIFTILFLFLTLQFTFIRLLALIIVLMIVEISLVLIKKTSLKNSIIRVLAFLIIFFYFTSQGYDGGPATLGANGIIRKVTNYIAEGNWFVLIHPLSGFSLTLIPAQYADLLQTHGSASTLDYLTHVALRFVPIMFLTLITISIILPVKTIRFFFISVILNCCWLLLLYFFGSHSIVDSRIYLFPQAVFGSLILTISFSLGIEWYLTNRSNNLLFVAFIAPLLTFFFIFVTWFVNLGKNSLIVYSPIDKYLPVPELGISLFLAALFTMVLTRKYASLRQKRFLGTLSVAALGLFFWFIFYSSYNEIQYFKIRKSEGVNLEIQKNLQTILYNSYIKNNGNRVIYYSRSSEAVADNEQGLLLDSINSWSYVWWTYNGRKDKLGCIMTLIREWDQPVAITKVGGEIFFQSTARCPVKSDKLSKLAYQDQMMTMPLADLFAFTLKNGQIIDVTENVKRKLQQR